jgi:hypothetical protein
MLKEVCILGGDCNVLGTRKGQFSDGLAFSFFLSLINRARLVRGCKQFGYIIYIGIELNV